jgi:hypothetical protein
MITLQGEDAGVVPTTLTEESLFKAASEETILPDPSLSVLK